MKSLLLIVSLFIANLSASAFAATYKCSSTSINPDVIRYEVELSFDPLVFRLDEFFKEEDGSWSLTSEMLADAEGVLKPVKIPWSACQRKLNFGSTEISHEWSKGSLASGHLFLNLNSNSGEFLSAIETAGSMISRRVQFSDCVKSNSN